MPGDVSEGDPEIKTLCLEVSEAAGFGFPAGKQLDGETFRLAAGPPG